MYSVIAFNVMIITQIFYFKKSNQWVDYKGPIYRRIRYYEEVVYVVDGGMCCGSSRF